MLRYDRSEGTNAWLLSLIQAAVLILLNCICAGKVFFKFKLDHLIKQHQGYVNKDSDEHKFLSKFLTNTLLSIQSDKYQNNYQ